MSGPGMVTLHGLQFTVERGGDGQPRRLLVTLEGHGAGLETLVRGDDLDRMADFFAAEAHPRATPAPWSPAHRTEDGQS
jgi:hypothetical protein